MRFARIQQGVSMLEALVAMAVMAIGAVAVVGMQSTLRLNGDVAKQRAEAVRLAQETLETWRGFSTFTATAAATDWSDIDTVAATDINGVNTTFSRAVTVVSRGATDENPLSKTVHVRVSWLDRAGQSQRVELNSIVAGIHPELGGSLSLPVGNSLLRNPGGRNPVIPRGAIDQSGGGSSMFSPPGAGTVGWVFNNVTGLVTQTCTNANIVSTCTDVRGMLLSGFVRFSTGLSQPTTAQAASPSSPALATLAVSVDQEVPYSTSVSCFEEYSTDAVAYFCLLQVNLVNTAWTGTTRIDGINVASLVADHADDKFKVCRYTTVRSNAAVVPANLKNSDHPLRYVGVGESLANQNFLVIRAGDSSNAFVCPDDVPPDSPVNTATWFHQPAN
jgi:Tfp pilus assembly protein PilV